jgi:nitrogen PTS system EIIA component
MELEDLIRQDAILPQLKASSKKQVLQELAQKAAELTALDERDIFDTVMERERLGSTGVGNGIAIPHGKLAELDKITGVFGRLARPVGFDALDDEPVDLVFLLIAPAGSGADHLKALSKIARLLRNPETVASLRASQDAAEIYSLIKSPPPAPA